MNQVVSARAISTPRSLESVGGRIPAESKMMQIWALLLVFFHTTIPLMTAAFCVHKKKVAGRDGMSPGSTPTSPEGKVLKEPMNETVGNKKEAVVKQSHEGPKEETLEMANTQKASEKETSRDPKNPDITTSAKNAAKQKGSKEKSREEDEGTSRTAQGNEQANQPKTEPLTEKDLRTEYTMSSGVDGSEKKTRKTLRTQRTLMTQKSQWTQESPKSQKMLESPNSQRTLKTQETLHTEATLKTTPISSRMNPFNDDGTQGDSHSTKVF
ncbi:hypothetical protein QR680_016779 [Steinernema hermaphroditum]|uniref:Uncharacterized protein n=1 Tax=Steinernema hermaphroditum TaxID=289476 RepID=A0AA39LMW4_9BILA|nr:hypothetical protein QR680_016779 [Steinernema hermaphroditum]